MDKSLCLTVSHPRLGKQDVFHRLCSWVSGFNGTVYDQFQCGEILFDLPDMGICDTDGLFLFVADVQQLHQALGDRFRIDMIQNFGTLFGVTLFPKIRGGQP